MRLFLFDWEWIGKMQQQNTSNDRMTSAIRRTGSDAGVAGSGPPRMGNSQSSGPNSAQRSTGAGRAVER
jgi:hypothetical protein